MRAFLAFVVFVLNPGQGGDARGEAGAVHASCRQVLQAAALATIVCVGASAAVNAAVLAASLPVSWSDIAGAGFVLAGGVEVLAAAVIGAVGSLRTASALSTRIVLCVAGLSFVAAGLADSHAVARLQDNDLLLLATAAHELGAALWLGGLPCFWVVLGGAERGERASQIGRRFSVLAAIGVALILIGAAVFVPLYLGSFGAVYGTAYG